MKPGRAKTIDQYITACAPEVRPILRKLRATIRKAAPKATELISYQMPAFNQVRNLVYFGAFKTHIGLFPPVRDRELRVEAAKYAGPKGNLKFPLDEPMPYGLIGRIVKARVREETAKKQSSRRRANIASA